MAAALPPATTNARMAYTSDVRDSEPPRGETPPVLYSCLIWLFHTGVTFSLANGAYILSGSRTRETGAFAEGMH